MSKAIYDYITRVPCTAKTPLTPEQYSELFGMIAPLECNVCPAKHFAEALHDRAGDGDKDESDLLFAAAFYLRWLADDINQTASSLYAFSRGMTVSAFLDDCFGDADEPGTTS